MFVRLGMDHFLGRCDKIKILRKFRAFFFIKLPFDYSK